MEGGGESGSVEGGGGDQVWGWCRVAHWGSVPERDEVNENGRLYLTIYNHGLDSIVVWGLSLIPLPVSSSLCPRPPMRCPSGSRWFSPSPAVGPVGLAVSLALVCSYSHEWLRPVIVFLFQTYFAWHNHLQFRLICPKWHDSVSSLAGLCQRLPLVICAGTDAEPRLQA